MLSHSFGPLTVTIHMYKDKVVTKHIGVGGVYLWTK